MRTIKLTILIVFTLFALFDGVVFALTANFSNIPLSEFLNYVSSQEKVNFVYPSKLGNVTISVDLQNVDIETALRMVLLPLRFDYEKVSNDTYLIIDLSSYTHRPNYVAVYEPRYTDPKALKVILQKIGIESFLLNSKLVYYTITKNQLSQVADLLANLDTTEKLFSHMLLVKFTYFSLSEFHSFKEISAEDFGKILLKEKYKSLLQDTRYVLFNYSTEKQNSNLEEFLVREPSDTSIPELILANFEFNENDIKIKLELLRKNESTILKVSSDLTQYELPLSEIKDDENIDEAFENAVFLKSGNFVVGIQAYKISARSLLIKEDTISTIPNNDFRKVQSNVLKSSFEVTIDASTAEVSVASENKKFYMKLAHNPQNGWTDWNVQSSGVLVKILDKTYAGVLFNFFDNTLCLVIEDEIDIFKEFSLIPKISFNVNSGSFSTSIGSNFSLSLSGVSVLIGGRISKDSSANTPIIGFKAALGFKSGRTEYWVGVNLESHKTGFYGAIKW
ncbi:secretin and TonB N-terminal domain-containing protein [Fervidobacterium pennivorans]|uniref:secretin and TonB N-terminal domain-containing protein n=1 Tax=Fervidobacterium pennivorans TaxID=93466 RepID=UPI001436B97E|nr:secretin and TonB N-terminal domain-containing protein [Fervidobacterium pennivorans]QIV78713.1 hypothetical protein HER11_07085 [Fervidobacterium pennivorans subsp. keratinolyticus]